MKGFVNSVATDHYPQACEWHDSMGSVTCNDMETAFRIFVGQDGQNGPQFKVADPSQTVAWGGRLPSRRRAITGFSSGLAIGVYQYT